MEDNIKNSETYLKSVIGKDNGFSIPKDYLESIEQQFSIKKIDNQFNKENSFKVPENYFDNLEETILSNVVSEKKRGNLISLQKRIYKIIPAGIAASIILFISIFYFNTNSAKVSFDSLAKNDIETWIIDNSTFFTSEEIATFIIDDNEINIDDFSYANLENEAIEDYIIYNENTSLLNEIN